ncbi:MAG: putative signal-transduction protein with domain [Nocardioides sp.]|nr:putative signal-transduction protein with domain [Nocardioides sp.]
MTMMTARPGDRLVVRSVHVGEHVRDAEILEVKHEDGSPPYVVRWTDTGHEGLVFPGADAFVEHADRDPSDG